MINDNPSIEDYVISDKPIINISQEKINEMNDYMEELYHKRLWEIGQAIIDAENMVLNI